MKKLLAALIILLSIGLGSVAHAQQFSARLVAGLNAAQIDGDMMRGYNQPGVIIGAGVEYLFENPQWGMEARMLYSQKGARTSTDDINNNPFLRMIRYRLNYIDIPLMVNFYPTDKFLIQGGLMYNVLLSARFDDGDGYVTVTDAFKPFDLAYTAGMSYKVLDQLSIGFNFNYSLIEMNSISLADAGVFGPAVTGNRRGAFNNVLSFMVHYYLIRPTE